jgi:hypothetical protein
MTVSDAAKRYGVNIGTLSKRVKKYKLEPIAVEKIKKHYDPDQLLHLAYLPKDAGRSRAAAGGSKRGRLDTAPCTRCGKNDVRNHVRGGLCLECFSHDYCANKGI